MRWFATIALYKYKKGRNKYNILRLAQKIIKYFVFEIRIRNIKKLFAKLISLEINEINFMVIYFFVWF